MRTGGRPAGGRRLGGVVGVWGFRGYTGQDEEQGEGRERQEAEEMKVLFRLPPGGKGPGCDKGKDGKSHWSCWFEKICLWNKLFISQL